MEPERLTGLLDAATAEVPQAYRAAPLAGIERRIRRRRVATAALVSIAVAVVLGGLAAAAVAAGPAQRQPAVAPAPVSPDPAALPWLSAMVARDDRTITVYAGATGCRDLVEPRAQLTAADGSQLVIAVYGRIVNAGDCVTAGRAVPVVVQVPDDLGTRAIRDAASGNTHPLYYQRNLPDVAAAGWPSADASWDADNDGWYQAFNGPNGGVSISLLAQPTAKSMDFGPVLTTIQLGSHRGSITGGQQGLWRVSWQVDDVTYSLLFAPAEGGTFTLTQFTELLHSLKWS